MVSGDKSYEPFNSTFDVEMQLSYHSLGWRKVAKDKDSVTFTKRFGGVWYKVWVSRSPYSSSVYLSPSKMPQSLMMLHGEAYEHATEPLRATLDVKGLTVTVIEAKIEELIAANRAVLTTRTRKDRAHFYFRGENGSEAFVTWKKEVERVLLEILGGKNETYDTHSLVLDVLRNHMLEPDAMTYAEASRAVRGVLDSMARRGLVDKLEYSRTKVCWSPRAAG